MEQQISVNIDKELISEAQAVLNNYGIDVNSVLNDCLYKIVEEGYEPKKKVKNRKEKTPGLTMSDLWGVFEGQLWTSDDFDEPLDELKEYME